MWKVKQLVAGGVKPDEKVRKSLTTAALRLVQLWDTLKIENGILLKTSKINDEVVFRVVIPRHKRQECLEYVHDKMGHLGKTKTYILAQERFYWNGLQNDVDAKVKHCQRCICAKSPHLPEQAPLVSIITSRPMEVVFMDFVGLETSKGGYNYILVITDHFTKYAAAFPTRNQEAKTVAKILVDQYFTQYGIPERINTDQGASFQGKLMRNLCQMLGLEKTNTTIYHPQSDGIVERYNKTLLQMLRSLENDQKVDWKSHVQTLTHAYNCSRHESTGFSPFYLMFGRKPRIPVDVFLGRNENYCDTVTDIRERLETAYRAAEGALCKSRAKQTRNYDVKLRGQPLRVADAVLLKNICLKGKQKVADKWQTTPFTVIEHPNPDIPVFKIKQGRTVKTIHRNLLLPIQLPLYAPNRDQSSVRQNRGKEALNPLEPQGTCDNFDVSDDDFYFQANNAPDSGHQQPACDDWPSQTHALFPSPPPPTPRVTGEQLRSNPLAQPPITQTSPIHHPYHAFPSPIGQPDISGNSPDGSEQVAGVSVGEPPVEGDIIPEQVSDVDAPQLRRSQRERRAPTKYGEWTTSNVVAVDSEWRDKIQVLLSLFSLFPAQQLEIFNAMIRVISCH